MNAKELNSSVTFAVLNHVPVSLVNPGMRHPSAIIVSDHCDPCDRSPKSKGLIVIVFVFSV